MKPRQLMIGLAGHVDHGKSALVQHLTGRNPQRHPEELKRGMTLDISVRPLTLSDGTTIGVVDVPGHKDLVRNMVAGVTAIDIALLIVAADDGVMPQTVEHARVLSLVRPKIVIPIITKIDLVDTDRVDEVIQEVTAALENVGITPQPVQLVSNVSGQGVNELHELIDQTAIAFEPRADNRAFRMDVRHVFSVKGFGTVVTGVPISGKVQVGDKVQILPSRREAFVRSLQNYHKDVERAPYHASVAICLRELPMSEIERGMVICEPGVYAGSDRFVCKIRSFVFLKTRDRTEFLLHVGTQRTSCHLLPIGGKSSNLEEGYFLVTTTSPVVVTIGDTVILRASGSEGTVAGGQIHSLVSKRNRIKGDRGRTALDSASRALLEGDTLAAACATAPTPIVDVEYLQASTGRTKDSLLRQLSVANNPETAVSSLSGDVYLLHQRASELHPLISRLVSNYHKKHKLVWGMKPSLLCTTLGLPAESFNVVWPHLQPKGVIIRFNRVSLERFSPALSKRQTELRDKILAEISKAELNITARGDLAARTLASPNDVDFAIELLLEEETIVALGPRHLITQKYWDKAWGIFREVADRDGSVSIGSFREATKMGRTGVVLLLESFDERGLSVRKDDCRTPA